VQAERAALGGRRARDVGAEQRYGSARGGRLFSREGCQQLFLTVARDAGDADDFSRAELEIHSFD
jgi:hypothetical protein